MRKLSFVNDGYYHIFNRGVDRRRIFLRNGQYVHFLQTTKHILNFGTAQHDIELDQSLAFRRKLSFMCYCLMPNHYHFLLKQKEDGAISAFMHKLNTSYTKYFNLSQLSQKRTGRLFEYTFKAVQIDSDEQLLHASRYIHLNPLIANLTSDLNTYQWSSYLDYTGKRKGTLCEKEQILSMFGVNAQSNYQQFVLDQIDYAKELHLLKEVRLD